MNKKQLHIVSFDVPYPPQYGGVIDVFYKIKALHKLGVKIYLHVYDNGIGEQVKLNDYCEQVFYYPRTLTISKVFSKIPFIVKTRSSNDLIQNLNNIIAPILFEGIHTTFPLMDTIYDNRIILFRAHNIEHKYYNGLAASETSKRKKLFYKTESKKLKRFEPIVNRADYILPISQFEFDYFDSTYSPKSIYIPAFHQNNQVLELSPRGKYAFYHGDLRISDNLKSVSYLIKIFSKLKHKLIIAGGIINKMLINDISNYDNIDFIKIKDNNHLLILLQNAHANILPTFQKTGIKLKLINTLFNSRFCLVNDKMIEGTGLEELCTKCNSIEDFRKNIDLTFGKDFTDKHRQKRILKLSNFNNLQNANLIIDLLD